ncbi:hypothetical protein ACFLZV_04095 [Candidatus Margulisiibacteriota bacterium]
MNKENYRLGKNVKKVFETPDDASYFFGYYDKCPVNCAGRFLLTHKVDFDGRDITKDDTAEIGVWDLSQQKYKKLSMTRSFNWQQGSMLQWLPPKFKDKIIYNDRIDGKFVSVIFNLNTGEKTIIPFPVYAVHPSGEFALGINYERYFFIRPGYNYQGIVNNEWNTKIPTDDGIYKVDLTTGKVTLLLALERVVNFRKSNGFIDSYNFLEFMFWNPSGTRFVFFHRWNDRSGCFRTRLFTCDQNGQDLYLFPDVDFISHLNWHDDSHFTVWASEPTLNTQVVKEINKNVLYKKYIKPIYQFIKKRVFNKNLSILPPNTHFIDFKDLSNDYALVGKTVLTSDGHNSWSADGRYMLTDTYQDSQNYRKLLLYDSLKDVAHLLGEFYSTYNNSGYRCDLHPRFSRDGRKVILDSAHRKSRGIIVLGISAFVQ